MPSGSHIHLRYEPGQPPILAARIQEMFGLEQTPTVASGRVPVLLHLLAPSMRPQQVTRDLASFWRNTYPQVRKELRARYPKWAWPEDPMTAKAQRRPERKRAANLKCSAGCGPVQVPVEPTPHIREARLADERSCHSSLT